MSVDATIPTIRVITVDPHPLVREGIRQSLSVDPTLEVVAEASDVTAAMLASMQHQNDVLILNAFLPQKDIFQVLRDYKRSFSKTGILVCFTPQDPEFLQDLLEGGSDALVGQEALSAEYLAAVRAISAGGVYLSADLLRCLLSSRAGARATSNQYGLTSREVEVLLLLSKGLNNKEIANKLDLSVRTAEAHRLNIRKKTSANTLSDLMRVARALTLSPANGAYRDAVLDDVVQPLPLYRSAQRS